MLSFEDPDSALSSPTTFTFSPLAELLSSRAASRPISWVRCVLCLDRPGENTIFTRCCWSEDRLGRVQAACYDIRDMTWYWLEQKSEGWRCRAWQTTVGWSIIPRRKYWRLWWPYWLKSVNVESFVWLEQYRKWSCPSRKSDLENAGRCLPRIMTLKEFFKLVPVYEFFTKNPCHG